MVVVRRRASQLSRSNGHSAIVRIAHPKHDSLLAISSLRPRAEPKPKPGFKG